MKDNARHASFCRGYFSGDSNSEDREEVMASWVTAEKLYDPNNAVTWKGISPQRVNEQRRIYADTPMAINDRESREARN